MKEKVEKLKDEMKWLRTQKDMCELLNEKFQQVFTKEKKFNKPKYKTLDKQMGAITVS